MTRLWPSLLGLAQVIQPDTILRWHRAGFRTYWRWKSRGRVGRSEYQAASCSCGLLAARSLEVPQDRAAAVGRLANRFTAGRSLDGGLQRLGRVEADELLVGAMSSLRTFQRCQRLTQRSLAMRGSAAKH
jgi:hypothetical protein